MVAHMHNTYWPAVPAASLYDEESATEILY
jgi:hypothetical protein